MKRGRATRDGDSFAPANSTILSRANSYIRMNQRIYANDMKGLISVKAHAHFVLSFEFVIIFEFELYWYARTVQHTHTHSHEV